MPILKTATADFYYELHGQGQPLIFISGYRSDHQIWTPLLSTLSATYQMLIFDNRGIGKTTDDGRELSAELMAEDVVTLMEQLHLKKPHIVGHSMGGRIAQMLAIHHPDKIEKLVLIGSSAKWRQAMRYCFAAQIQMREAGVDPRLITKAMMPWLFGENFLQKKEMVAGFEALAWEMRDAQSLNDHKRQYRVLEQFDSGDQLKQIQAKTLVISGNEDLVVLPAEAEFLAKEIPNAELVFLPCGHLYPVEVTKALVGLLSEFLIN